MLLLIWADEKYNTPKNPCVVFANQTNPGVFHRPKKIHFGQNIRPKKILRTPTSLKYVSGAPGLPGVFTVWEYAKKTFRQISNSSSNLKVSTTNRLSGVAFILILFYFLLHEWSAQKSVDGQRKKGRRTAWSRVNSFLKTDRPIWKQPRTKNKIAFNLKSSIHSRYDRL